MLNSNVFERHRWQCPVIMKTDPDHVAYTCARCGLIGVVAAGDPLAELRLWASTSGAPEQIYSECRRSIASIGR